MGWLVWGGFEIGNPRDCTKALKATDNYIEKDARHSELRASTRAMDMTSFNETIKKIDESFRPDGITVTKTIKKSPTSELFSKAKLLASFLDFSRREEHCCYATYCK